ncbi:MAG: hypothetical protein JWO05_2168 [Gemmatimonadetes bacterium]|nr:hypothetical protein [Gemmatimonadota bacterium]
MVDVANGGAIDGKVTLIGGTPADVELSTAAQACGTQAGDARAIEATDGALANVVVWLSDARTGRALPVEKRYEVTSERCVIAPRIQVAALGGTVNFRHRDDREHHYELLRDGSPAVISNILFMAQGQVVPMSPATKSPGLVEIRCRDHPWERAWVATFDQPYYSVSGAGGAFHLDGIPPGTYHLKAWHERATAPVETVVTVVAGQTASVSVSVALR